MEATLSEPPAWLEQMVLLAIPPAAREAVAGDLWETYRSPGQYAGEALRTVPFIIASQIRRNLNLPALMLQGALIFIGLGGMATLLLIPLLMLREAYQPVARPSARRAIREAVLLSMSAVALLLLIMSVRSPFPVRAGVDHFTWLSLFLAGLFLSPFLCLFRAGLILQGDRSLPLANCRRKIWPMLTVISCTAPSAATCCRPWRWLLRPPPDFSLPGTSCWSDCLCWRQSICC
jgi:hypothetical protein